MKHILVFDHSSGHTAFPEDALHASRINVKPGPVIHDIICNGKTQKMVLPCRWDSKGDEVSFTRAGN